jgi:DNA-binding response OmpR family regulator
MPEIKCRILCVDDHEDSSELLKLLLTEADNEVHIAHTMDEAVQLAKAHEFDLYVIDKHLPDGSGVELCRMLGELTPGVPCIFYSGDTYETHRQEALAAGADAFVAKPDVDALIATVENILSERECATAT